MPDAKDFLVRNMDDMKRFFKEYADPEILQLLAAKSVGVTILQPAATCRDNWATSGCPITKCR
jgi:hypothetical protein